MTLSYQLPDSTLTLEDGLAEYYAAQPGLIRGRGISPAAREFFRCHDATHVVFGCSTTLVNEMIVKIWSFLGITAGLRLVDAYRLPESREVYEHLAWLDIAGTSLRSLTVVPLVLWRCARLRKRWPWSEFDGYLAVGLAEIRRDFGIELVLR